MTSVRKFAGVLFLGLLFTASAAMADIVNVTFDGVSGNQLGGQFTYQYYLDINGGPWIAVACDDYADRSNPGDNYNAYRTYLSSGNISNTKYPNDFVQYQEAAWLFGQFTPANQAQWGDISWAIWEFFTPGLNEGSDQPIIDQWMQQASQNYLNAPYWTDLVILTPINAPDQEMIYLGTPEPGTLLLLGSSIVGLWSQRKRLF